MSQDITKYLADEIALLIIKRGLVTEEIDRDIENLKTSLSYYQRKEWSAILKDEIQSPESKGDKKEQEIHIHEGNLPKETSTTEIPLGEYRSAPKKVKNKAKCKRGLTEEQPTDIFSSKGKLLKGKKTSVATKQLILYLKENGPKSLQEIKEYGKTIGLVDKTVINYLYNYKIAGVLIRTGFKMYDYNREKPKELAEERIEKFNISDSNDALKEIEKTREKNQRNTQLVEVMKNSPIIPITPSRESLQNIPITDAKTQFRDFKGEIVKAGDRARILPEKICRREDDLVEYPDCLVYSNVVIKSIEEGSSLLKIQIEGRNTTELVYPHWLRKLQA